MNCLYPRRIKNQYTDKWLYVGCRNCDACKIASANHKSLLLSTELDKYKYVYLVTLDYDNFSVPYVLPNDNCIYRLASFVRTKGNKQEWLHSKIPIVIDEFPTEDIVHKGVQLQKHRVKNAIGVLYYKDLQNFFKRFRKSLNGENTIKFGFSAVLEYGPNTKRPHFHVAIFSNNLEYERLKSSVIQSWPLCDWNRLKDGKSIKEESIKRATTGISSYIASYVNCTVSDYGVHEIKRFRQRVVRSKNAYFGIDPQSLQSFERYVNGQYDKNFSCDGRHVFETIDTKRVNRISTRPISARVFSAFFPKFRGCSDLPFDAFTRCARLVFARYFSGFRKELIENGFLKSADCSFICAYKRYLNYFDLPLNIRTFDIYCDLNYRARSAYSSLVLRHEMETYPLLGKVNYYLCKINSYAHDLRKKERVLTFKIGFRPLPSQMVVPPVELNRINSYVHHYKYKLLVKHFNDL